MKQIAVISGKGGTGKTILTTAFSLLLKNKILADCDVDAANLHILTKPENIKTTPFTGGKIAVVDSEKCSLCETCIQHCRFNALSIENDVITVNTHFCEGCGVCVRVCPEQAFHLEPQINGERFTAKSQYGMMSHAKLGIAEDNSGKLVTEVKNEAVALADEYQTDYVLIDGPPGVGCPVISTLSGVDYIIIVTEPTLSGLHDLKRVIQLSQTFDSKIFACVNKSDLNSEMADKIENYCDSVSVGFLGKIPFDKNLVSAMARKINPMEYPDCFAKKDIRQVFDNFLSLID